MIIEHESDRRESITQTVSGALSLAEELVMRSYGFTGVLFEQVNNPELDTHFQQAIRKIDSVVNNGPIDPDEAETAIRMINDSFDQTLDPAVMAEPIVYIGSLISQPSIVLPYVSIARHTLCTQSIDLLSSEKWANSENPDIFEHSIQALRSMLYQMKLPHIWGNKYKSEQHKIASAIGRAYSNIFASQKHLNIEVALNMVATVTGDACSPDFLKGVSSGLVNVLRDSQIMAASHSNIHEWLESVFVDPIHDGKTIYFGDGWVPTNILYEPELHDLYGYILSKNDFISLAIITNALLETFYQNANTSKRDDLIAYIQQFPNGIATNEFQEKLFLSSKDKLELL